jgi:hypothetical protein
MGNRAAAEQELRAMTELGTKRFISEYDFAVATSGWKPEETLRWLEAAAEGRTGLLVYARVDSVFDDLRAEPRFQDVVRRVGIPEGSRP